MAFPFCWCQLGRGQCHEVSLLCPSPASVRFLPHFLAVCPQKPPALPTPLLHPNGEIPALSHRATGCRAAPALPQSVFAPCKNRRVQAGGPLVPPVMLARHSMARERPLIRMGAQVGASLQLGGLSQDGPLQLLPIPSGPGAGIPLKSTQLAFHTAIPVKFFGKGKFAARILAELRPRPPSGWHRQRRVLWS